MYYCQLCNYQTKHRNQIELHHISPVKNGGSNKNFNLVYLCPLCHCKIYIPGSKHSHNIRTNSSIIINGWKKSTGCSRILFVMDIDGNEFLFEEMK
jgi:predicted HNH restriction endonuclease